MSRGDDNLDKLFQDAFNAQEHEMSPHYWQEAQHLLNANKGAPVPFYSKPLLLVGTAITVAISAILFSDSTPETHTELATNSVEIANELNHITPKKAAITEGTSVFEKTNTTPLTFTTPPNKTEGNNGNAINRGQPLYPINKKASTSLEVIIPSLKGSSIQKESNPASYGTTLKYLSKTVILKKYFTTSEYANPDTKSTPLNLSKPAPHLISWDLKTIHTRTLSGLSHEHFNLTQPNYVSKKHKRLASPYNLRLSIGTMWSEIEKSSITNVYKDDHLELSVEYQFKKRFGVQAGISFSQSNVTQNYSYTDEHDLSYWNEEQVITTTTNRVWWLGDWYYYAPNMDTTINRIYISQFDTVNNKLTITHKVQQIEIPILVTYNYGIHRLNIQISTGLSFNKPLNTRGSSFISEDPFPIKTSISKHLNSIQTNFLFRSEIAYGLDDKWWVTVRPQMKINMNSLYQSPSTIEPRLWYYGINLGIMYKF
ncbi:MAG: hypothetical protein ACI9GM_000886 [Salibacteraceae bacterium]|jgi:hypothetical protein